MRQRERFGRCPWCRTFSVNCDRFQEDTYYCTICHTRFPKSEIVKGGTQ